MRIKNLITSKRYVKKIYLWTTIGMLLVLMVFSLASYFIVKNDIMDNERNTNTKILNQIKFNINYMDEMIVNLCFTTYYNSNITNLMQNNNIDYTDVLYDINTIKTSIINTNPYIKSVYIYNGQTKTYYTTYNEINFEDTYLEELIKSYKQVPRLVPIYRKLYTPENKDEIQNVFTYFIYETVHEEGDMNRAVIINCDADWLLDNINELNNVGDTVQNEILIMNENGEFIGNTFNSSFKNELKLKYMDYIKQSSDKTMGIFKCKLENKDYLVTFTNAENANWVLIKTQLYDQVFESINNIRTAFIFITLFIILLAFLISLQITKSIYNPIKRLVTQMKTYDIPVDDKTENDEISFMEKVYNSSIDQLKVFKEQKASENVIIKTYFLRKLLTDSYSISKEEFDSMKIEKDIVISSLKPLQVCVIKIDDFKKHLDKYNRDDRNLFNFAIMKITDEILSDSFDIEVMELKNDQIVIILNIDTERENTSDTVETLLKYAQESIYKNFNISISAALSRYGSDIKELTRLYNEALDILLYRLVYGKMSVITHDMITRNIENKETEIEASLKRKLIQEIKIGNLEKISEVVDSIFKDISGFNYNGIILALMQFVNVIKATVDEINLKRLEPIYFDSNFLAKEILNSETIEELKVKINQVLENVVSKSGSGYVEYEKQLVLANAVKEIIDANYSNSGLYLAEIADKLNLSAKHVGRVFKAVTGISITDYINDVRLNKVIEWLNGSSLSIHEIIPKVGIENESYFYKLFKAKFGLTPRDYISNMNLKKML